MKHSLPARTLRVVAALVTIAAWFFASNHCAFAGMAALHGNGHEHCSGHHSPEKSKGDGLECCKSLRPASVSAEKNWLGYDTYLFSLQRYFVVALISPDESRAGLRPLELDTGPPFAGSFAEAVLQRSILAHAPPVLA